MASTQTTTNVLITGVNRGIGRALTEVYLTRPNHLVVGSVRDLTSKGALELQSWAASSAAPGSKLLLVKIESASLTDPAAAVASLRADHGLDRLDIVIANAAINGYMQPVATTDPVDFRAVLDVNTVGPVVLFQAVLPLLEASSRPTWVGISTMSGTIGQMEQTASWPSVGYGASKAAFNFITRAIHFQHEKFVSIAIHPGFVKTDMGNNGAKFFGLEEAWQEVDESIEGILKIVDNSSREKSSGKFFDYLGEEKAW